MLAELIYLDASEMYGTWIVFNHAVVMQTFGFHYDETMAVVAPLISITFN